VNGAHEVYAGIEAMASMFRRLGLMWRLTTGTVFSATENTPTLTLVTLDGDDDPSNCISMAGQVPIGARVYVMIVPPQSNYIVGISSGGMRLWQSRLAQASSLLGLTTAVQIVPGATITVDVPPGAVYEADIVTEVEKISTNASTTAVGQLYLDGAVAGTQQALYKCTTANAGDRASVAQNYGPTAVSAGSHTWDIRGNRAGGADGALRINSVHTTLRLRIYT
jgi:hypothetical protein